MHLMSNSPFWQFPRSIHFQSKAPLEEIVRELTLLKEGKSSGIHHDMTVEPLKKGHSFRHSIQRHNTKQGWSTTAYGEGQLWENASGLVTVNGTARIDSGIYINLAIMLMLMLIGDFLLAGSLSILFLFFLIIAPIMIYNSCSDRDRLVERISEAVGQASYNSSEKAKRLSPDESINETSSTIDHALTSNSIWHEAVSEYDNSRQ